MLCHMCSRGCFDKALAALVRKQGKSSKDATDEVLCTRANFPGETTDKGRKAASNASSAMFGGTAFAMKVSAEGLQASMSMLVKKVEEAADDLWFLAAPPPRMCQHLLR